MHSFNPEWKLDSALERLNEAEIALRIVTEQRDAANTEARQYRKQIDGYQSMISRYEEAVKLAKQIRDWQGYRGVGVLGEPKHLFNSLVALLAGKDDQ